MAGSGEGGGWLRGLARRARAGLVRGLAPLAARAGVVLEVRPPSPPPPDPGIPEAVFGAESELPGLDLRPAGQLALLAELACFRAEYEAIPKAPTGVAHEFHFPNDTFGPVDAELYWAMLRHLRPRRVIEVGAGRSTMLAAAALRRNATEGAPPAELVAVEPAPGPTLAAGFPGLTRLHAAKVEALGLDPFLALAAGDVLFIDSSHVLAPGNDVRFLYGEVLPRLAPGVAVHVHDVFLPGEYPRPWVVEQRRGYTEQYLLQAFLVFNREFEVLLAAAWLARRHPAGLAAAIPTFVPGAVQPGSFWFRRVSPSAG